MPAGKALLTLSAVLACLVGVQAGLDVSSDKNVAVYWGQNSYGQSTGPFVQQRLSYYCQNPDIDVFQLSFLTVINGAGGVPETNFANAGDNCTTFPGTNLLNCPQIQEDIKSCQGMGKTILLSIGGATYTEGGFSSDAAAVAGAELVWNTFGPVPAFDNVKRPFGDAVVDGFDFDFESTVNHMPAFGNKLRDLFASDTSKSYYLTAAPQCVFPDAANGPMLDGTVYFDAIWVQFYNNWCGLQNFRPDSAQNPFNFDTWNNWALTTSKNPNVKVMIGVPAAPGAAGSGYQPVSSLEPIIDYAAGFPSFGGIMMWDASQAYSNSGFISGIASALGGAQSPPPGQTSTATPTTMTTTTSPASTPTGAGTVPQWGQCGGKGYTGPTECSPPYQCVSQGAWWSSCQ